MRTLLACLIALMAAALPAQEVKKPKSEFPAEGLATFRLRVRSIPTIQVKINGATLTLGVDTGCQGTGVLTPRGAAKCDVTEAFTVPSMGNSGRSENTFGYVEKLEAGGAVWRDFHISIMPACGRIPSPRCGNSVAPPSLGSFKKIIAVQLRCPPPGPSCAQ